MEYSWQLQYATTINLHPRLGVICLFGPKQKYYISQSCRRMVWLHCMLGWLLYHKGVIRTHPTEVPRLIVALGSVNSIIFVSSPNFNTLLIENVGTISGFRNFAARYLNLVVPMARHWPSTWCKYSSSSQQSLQVRSATIPIVRRCLFTQ